MSLCRCIERFSNNYRNVAHIAFTQACIKDNENLRPRLTAEQQRMICDQYLANLNIYYPEMTAIEASLEGMIKPIRRLLPIF